ncbi:MAG: hypothetical protein ACJ72H_11475 [Candidatus Sulfotelmatobacter sp.]
MLHRFRAAARLVCAAGAIVILHVAEVRACNPVVFCSAIRVCTQAPSPWGPALREGTKVGDPLVIMERTDDCVRRSHFQGIGRYAKDWKRISDCGAYPQRYLNFAYAARRGACAGVR